MFGCYLVLCDAQIPRFSMCSCSERDEHDHHPAMRRALSDVGASTSSTPPVQIASCKKTFSQSMVGFRNHPSSPPPANKRNSSSQSKHTEAHKVSTQFLIAVIGFPHNSQSIEEFFSAPQFGVITSRLRRNGLRCISKGYRRALRTLELFTVDFLMRTRYNCMRGVVFVRVDCWPCLCLSSSVLTLRIAPR